MTPSAIISLTGAWFCRLGHANSLVLRLRPRGRIMEQWMFPPLPATGRRCKSWVLRWWSYVSSSAFLSWSLQTLSASALDFAFLFPPTSFNWSFYIGPRCGLPERPHDKLSERFALCKRHWMPAEYILNLLLILNLAWPTTYLPLAHWKQPGSTPRRPQPQYKQSVWNSSSQCSTDSKCLEKELLKITQCNRISAREAPGSMFPLFLTPVLD